MLIFYTNLVPASIIALSLYPKMLSDNQITGFFHQHFLTTGVIAVFSMERTLQKYAEIGVIRLPHACSDMCKIPIVVPLDFQMKSLVLELAWNESFGIFQPVRRE